MKDNSRLVYSTETGRLCPRCGKAANGCTCKKKKNSPPAGPGPFPADGNVRIRREKAGRGGKTVSAIYGLPADADLKDICRRLKQCCGTGGSVKEGTIIIQGDHRETLQAELVKQGFTVKLAGG